MAGNSIIRTIAENRRFAIESGAWARHMHELEIADRYIAGEQYPEWYDPSTTNTPYLVVNFLPDLVDRLTAMIGGGRLTTILDAPQSVDRVILDLARAQDALWQDMVSFKGRVLELVRSMVAYGLGAVRGYVDDTEYIELGGYIGFEYVYPGQVWISPLANDPFDPLMGSEFLGFEDVKTRKDIIRMFPGKQRTINQIDGMDISQFHTFDPVLRIMSRFAIDTGSSTDGNSSGDFSPGTIVVNDTPKDEVDEDSGKSDNDLMRFIEYVYVDYEQIDYGGFFKTKKIWKVITLVGDIQQWPDTSNIRVIDGPKVLPYGRPHFVLLSNWSRTNSPYSGGIVQRLGDLPDLINVVTSMMVSDMMQSTRYGHLMIALSKYFSDQSQQQLSSSTPPNVIFADEDIDEVTDVSRIAKPLDFGQRSFNDKIQLLGSVQEIIREVTGVHQPVIGNVDTKRTSSVSLGRAQQAVLSAQETVREHVNKAVTNMSTLALSMRAVHWTLPQQLNGVGDDNGTMYANITAPVTPQTTRRVDEMMSNQNYNVEGQTLIPTSVRAITTDGDEIINNIKDSALIREVASRDDIEFMDFGFNDLATPLGLVIRARVESDWEERRNEFIDLVGAIKNITGKSVVSESSLFEVAFGHDPSITYTSEQSKLLDDKLVELMNEFAELGDDVKQQVVQKVGQMLQQMQAQGSAKGQQGAVNPQPTAARRS